MDERTTMRFSCPAGCGAAASGFADRFVEGGGDPEAVYGHDSLVCAAAVHAGILSDSTGGLVNVTIRRGWGTLAGINTVGYGRPLQASTANGVASIALADGAPRTFTMGAYNLSLVEVQTISGHPSAPIDDSCGYNDD